MERRGGKEKEGEGRGDFKELADMILGFGEAKSAGIDSSLKSLMKNGALVQG